jgi:hypothetical protein
MAGPEAQETEGTEVGAMSLYKVTWKIDIEAGNPREAAERAKEIQLTPFGLGNLASIFEVRDHETGKKTTVDLSD